APHLLSPLFPYTTLFRSRLSHRLIWTADDSFAGVARSALGQRAAGRCLGMDRPRPVAWRVSQELVLLSARPAVGPGFWRFRPKRSEEHTSELQSRFDLVC